jgi:xanthine dehydrogenase accessory factor
MNSHQSTKDICQTIVEFIDGGKDFAVALVLKAEGSTPRKAGVRAVIDRNGKIYGTLGGGLVEAEAQRRAVNACQSKQPVVFDMDLYGPDRTADDPICGGSMRILVDPTAAKDRASYAGMAEALRNRRHGVMVTTIQTSVQTQVKSQWYKRESVPTDAAFPGADNIRSCMEHEAPQLFAEPSGGGNAVRHPQGSPTLQAFVEPVIPMPLLVIAGGGHIGQALALQASLVGFDVAVIDDRVEFTEPALYPGGTTTYCGDIPKKTAELSVGNDTYVVVVTRGHKLDAETLEACIHAPVAYVGMIGSRRKVALIRKNFIESGIATAEQFDRVFTPIGLDIGAVTVPEIAASITAELIAVRRKGINHKISMK